MATAPGPGLSALLAGIDVTKVPQESVYTVMRAQSRQLAWEQGRMFAIEAEAMIRRPFAAPSEVIRDSAPHPYAADEVRAALVLTRRAAERETDLAYTVVHVLPLVQGALLAGRIDRARARVFADHLAELHPDQIRSICRAVLPVAGRLTTWQLADRLRRLVIEVDPLFYERRYRKALEERRVIGYIDANGTATITAKGLAPEDAALALHRVDTLARAARLAGHPGTVDQVRADVLVGLLDGTLHGMSQDEIVSTLKQRCARTEEPTTSPEATPAPQAPAPGADATLDVRVALTTVLGRDDRPGELPGMGPITSVTARRIVHRQRRAQWRWIVVDTDGHMVCGGITRRRPRHLPRGLAKGGIVELVLSEAELAELMADPAGTSVWAPLIADVAAQYADREQAIQDLDAHPEDRFPREALRRHLHGEHCTCRGPGCRAPAAHCDSDHLTDHAEGGPTTSDDLTQLCRHDHGLKEAGWELQQPEPGHFVWRTPMGQTIPVDPEPLLPPSFQAPEGETPDPPAAEPTERDRAPPPDPETDRT